VVGPAAPTLFAAVLLGASLLAASVVPLSTSYAIADATGARRSVSGSFRQAPLFYGIFTLQVAVGAAITLAPGNPVALVVNAQVLNGIITPMLLTRADPGQQVHRARQGEERPHLQDRRHRLRRGGRCAVVCRARRNAIRPRLSRCRAAHETRLVTTLLAKPHPG
jgi:hypothetical protein